MIRSRPPSRGAMRGARHAMARSPCGRRRPSNLLDAAGVARLALQVGDAERLAGNSQRANELYASAVDRLNDGAMRRSSPRAEQRLGALARDLADRAPLRGTPCRQGQRRLSGGLHFNQSKGAKLEASAGRCWKARSTARAGCAHRRRRGWRERPWGARLQLPAATGSRELARTGGGRAVLVGSGVSDRRQFQRRAATLSRSLRVSQPRRRDRPQLGDRRRASSAPLRRAAARSAATRAAPWRSSASAWAASSHATSPTRCRTTSPHVVTIASPIRLPTATLLEPLIRLCARAYSQDLDLARPGAAHAGALDVDL